MNVSFNTTLSLLWIMFKSDLIQILRKLSKVEMRQLQELINSPYFNKNEQVTALFTVIDNAYPQFNETALDKESAYAHIFPREPFQDIKIRRLMSKLLGLVEQFLILQAVNHSETKKDQILHEVYEQRKMNERFLFTCKKMESAFKKQIADIELYLSQYQMFHRWENWEEENIGRRKSTKLQLVNDRLDAFYFVTKLKQACAMLSYQHVFQQEYRIELIEEVKALLSKEIPKEPLIAMYLAAFRTLYSPTSNHADFYTLKKLLSDQYKLIAAHELLDLHILAQNYCIRQLNRDEPAFIRVLFELYQMSLNHGLLQSKVSQLSQAFNNIVAVGLKLKEYNWIETFISDFSPKIDPKFSKDYRYYSLAKLHFAKGNFEHTAKLLRKLEFKDLFTEINAKMLLIKTYYELDQDELIDFQVENFVQFIRRKKILAYHKTNYTNFGKFAKRLLNVNPFDNTQKERFKNTLVKTAIVPEKEWFLEKLNAMN